METSRKPLTLLILTAAIVYLGYLIAYLPAALVYQWTQPFLKGVTLEGVSGTLWSGSARQVSVKHAPETIRLPETSWQLSPSALLTGKLVTTVKIGSPSSRIATSGHITASSSRLVITDFNANTTASWLLRFLPRSVIPGEFSGDIQLTASKLEIQGTQCLTLKGRAMINQGQFTSPLGTFNIGQSNAALRCQNNALVATIEQKSSDFITEASLSLASTGKYTINGHVSQGTNKDNDVEKGLRILGNPDTEGRYPIQWQGRI